MRWKRYLTLTLALFLISAWFVSFGGVAHAASVQTNSQPAPTPTKTTSHAKAIRHPPDEGYQYTVECCTSDLYVEMSQTTGYGPTQLEAEGSFNVSSSWSASVGISLDLVNATVGFNADASVTRGGACYYTPPNGVSGTVEIDAVYYVVYFDIYWHDSVTGVNTYQGGGSAQEFSYFQCYSWNN